MSKKLLQQAVDALNADRFIDHSVAVRALEAAIAQPLQPALEAWIVVKEHVWQHEDGGRPTLAYLLPIEFGQVTYPSFESASAFITEGKWPLGFVAIRLSAPLQPVHPAAAIRESATSAPEQTPISDKELDLMSEKALFCRISRQQFARAIEAAHGIGTTPQSAEPVQPAAPAPSEKSTHLIERWNIERDGDDLMICFNEHEKAESCQFKRYTPASSVPAAQPVQPTGWQPIEVAPKDYRDIQIWGRGGWYPHCTWGMPTYPGLGKGQAWIFQDGHDSNGPVYETVIDPTHWMPLPDAPKS